MTEKTKKRQLADEDLGNVSGGTSEAIPKFKNIQPGLFVGSESLAGHNAVNSVDRSSKKTKDALKVQTWKKW